MSFRSISRKLKKSFNKKLSKLAFDLDDESTNETPQWNVLITGGSGHLAEKLVSELIKTVTEELRPSIKESLEPFKTLYPVSDKEFNRQFERSIRLETKKRMPLALCIVLLDIIQPNEELLENDFTYYVNGSFTDSELMKEELRGIDTVFHLAAVGMTGQYATDRKACMDTNALGTMNLLSWCNRNNVSRFIYTSSIGVVFDGSPLNNATEDLEHTEKFYNYYCESKAHAEKIVQNASCDELKTTVLRFNGIYGPGEKRVTQRVVDFMLSGWWIGICKPNGVEAQTQLSSIDNCVQGLIKAEIALRKPNCKHGQIYNIMDRDPYGTFTFWTPLYEALGYSDSMIILPSWLLRLAGFLCQIVSNHLKVDPFMTSFEVDLLTVNTTFSLEKARREIGYDPSPSSMPEIVEMYKRDMPPPDTQNLKTEVFVYRAVLIIILISHVLNFTGRLFFLIFEIILYIISWIRYLSL